MERIESKLGSHSQYNHRGMREGGCDHIKGQYWRFKIHTGIAKTIELEYEKLIRVKYSSEDDRPSRSSKFLDIVLRCMLVQYVC